MTLPDQEILSAQAVSKMIGRSVESVRRYIQEGKLEATKVVDLWPPRYQIKETDVEKFLERREAGEFRRRYDGQNPVPNEKMLQGRDYTYMYMWFSQERSTELCRALDAKERLLIFEYFYWLKVNRTEEYKRMVEWMEARNEASKTTP